MEQKRKIPDFFLLIGAIIIRISFFTYETPDYLDFLTKWVDFFRQNGGFAALKYSVGNYNIPYLYFIAAFSYLPVKDLYLIKGLSCIFDFLLAYYSMKVAEKCGANSIYTRICFFTVLFLPTVIINSSVWAQCDSIYVALGIAGIYYALDDRPILSMVCFALSFGFKLQAVFVLPVCIILLIFGKYKPEHFLVFPLAYFILISPACLIGRPLLSAITLYFDQLGTVGSAPNYNAPALNALTGGSGSIISAVITMLLLFSVTFILRNRLSPRRVLILSCLIVILIPFLLPHMHDRYFFAADIMLVVLFCSSNGPWIFPLALAAVCQQFASLICYLAYLKTYYIPLGSIYLTNNRGSVAIIFALVLVTLYFIHDLRTETVSYRK